MFAILALAVLPTSGESHLPTVPALCVIACTVQIYADA